MRLVILKVMLSAVTGVALFLAGILWGFSRTIPGTGYGITNEQSEQELARGSRRP
jgi:hypothetical protein